MGIVHRKSSKDKAMRHRNFLYHKTRRQDAIAKSIREQEICAQHQPNDKTLFNQGVLWYKSGLSLEDASADLRENQNFVNGFEHASRIQNVEDDFFRRGAKAFFDGLSWEDIPENDKNNKSFIQGYEEAMTMHIGRHK